MGDKFVTGYLDSALSGGAIAPKAYTNGDVYVALSKTWAKKPIPFLFNIGWKATNAELFGLGGQSTRFMGRAFGGIGIPIPLGHNIFAVPSFGFTQEPPQVKNLSAILVDVTQTGVTPFGHAHLPTTLDYAVRVTQKDNPHFAFDIGVGQVADQIGYTFVSGVGVVPVNIQAKHIMGMGLSYRY